MLASLFTIIAISVLFRFVDCLAILIFAQLVEVGIWIVRGLFLMPGKRGDVGRSIVG